MTNWLPGDVGWHYHSGIFVVLARSNVALRVLWSNKWHPVIQVVDIKSDFLLESRKL